MGYKLLVFGYVTSLLLLTIGLLGIIFGDKFIHSFVSSNIKLVPPTDLYNSWLNPPIEVHLNFYIFNLKNGEDFQKKGAKPVFEEIGPFVFKENIVKEDIVDNMNYTITYRSRKYYQFIPELSAYEPDFPITTINMAPITIINMVRHTIKPLHSIINAVLKATGDTLLVTKPAMEILFGYEDNFLKLLSKFAKELVPTPYVGLFYGKNNSYDGVFTMYTGADDANKVGIIERWNHEDKVSVWSSPYADMLNGTDGTVLPPFIKKEDTIYIFNSDLCRSLYTKYQGTYKTLDNIELYTFAPDEYFFANYTVNPDNEGFCSPPGNCLPAGVLNLTNCLAGVPIIMSCPHFLYGDPKFIAQIDGVSPSPDLHKTTLNVEPTTGLLMKANKRIQFNTQLFKDSRIDMTKHIPEIMYPLFWADENFEIDKKNADKFYHQVKIPLLVLSIGKFVIFGLGTLTIFVCLIYSIIYWRRYSDSENNGSMVLNEESPLLN